MGVVSDANLALKGLNNILISRTNKLTSFNGAKNAEQAKKKKWKAFNDLSKSLDKYIIQGV